MMEQPYTGEPPMTTYIQERSFVASLSLTDAHDAQLRFYEVNEEIVVVKNIRNIAIDGSLYGITDARVAWGQYLTAQKTKNKELLLYFLCRKSAEGLETYEIKAKDEQFSANKSSLGNVVTQGVSISTPTRQVPDIALYVCPDASLKPNPGWSVSINDATLSKQHIKTGNVGPVQIRAPNGNLLGLYDEAHFNQKGWSLISCANTREQRLVATTVPIKIMLNIKEINIADPLA